MINELDVRDGLRQVRALVDETRWIQGSYLDLYYPKDGDYADGAVVRKGKIVGCLVGLTRLVAHSEPFTVSTIGTLMPPTSELSWAMEVAMRETINDHFIGEEFYLDDEEDEGDDVSVEGWNDVGSRTREQVLAMLDRAIERMSVSA